MPQINKYDLGIAKISTDSFTQVELFAGDTPPVVTDYGIVGSLGTAGIAAWTPVFVDPATRAVTIAQHGTQAPNAITTVDVAAGTSANGTVTVYKAGMFNIDALKWPASYDTTAKKLAAFTTGGNNQIYLKARAVV